MYEGVINIYKEKGFTSHDVVAKLRGILQMKKIGHTGTLDPDAEGVLPVCLGPGTKLCGMLTDERKVYRTVMLLGVETDTQDAGGRIIARRPVLADAEQACAAAKSFIGEYAQIPPMYSAVKINGRKLYELARQGKVVERKARTVTIFRIDVERIELPRVTMAVECSKGTYIRALCHDIGEKLGCGACMESLVRTRAGRFGLEDALTLGMVEQLRDEGTLAAHITPVEEMFDSCPKVRAAVEADKPVHNGNPISASQVSFSGMAEESGALLPGEEDGFAYALTADVSPDRAPEPPTGDRFRQGERYRLYDSENRFIGIYLYEKEQDRLRPEKIFISG